MKQRNHKSPEAHKGACLYFATNGLEDCDCGLGTKKRTVLRPQCSHPEGNHHVLASVVGAVIQCDRCMCARKVGEAH